MADGQHKLSRRALLAAVCAAPDTPKTGKTVQYIFSLDRSRGTPRQLRPSPNYEDAKLTSHGGEPLNPAPQTPPAAPAPPSP
jgi:hypothetical protein